MIKENFTNRAEAYAKGRSGYYWIKYGDECVCFISIKGPEEKDNH